MTDEEKVHGQFLDHGFLAEDIQLGINFLTEENKHWFSLLRDINHVLQKIVVAGANKHFGKTLDVKVLATFSGLRSLGNLQAAILTLERGMIAETRIMVRCLFENSFCIGALAEKPSEFIPMLRHDNVAAKRGQANALKNGSYSLTADVQMAIDKHLSNTDKAKFLDWVQVSKMSSLKGNYLFYKHLSDDSMHYSASSLNRYLVTDPNTKTWQGYNFGPGTKEEVSQTSSYCATASLPIAVGYLQITENCSFDDEIKALLERFKALNSIVPARKPAPPDPDK